MKNDWPCKCNHSRDEHIARSYKNSGVIFGAIAACEHDQAYFKGMCNCAYYIPMSNLEYLEALCTEKESMAGSVNQ